MKQNISEYIKFNESFVKKMDCVCELDKNVVSIFIKGKIVSLFDKEFFIKIEKEFAPIEMFIAIGVIRNKGVPITVYEDGSLSMNSRNFLIGDEIVINTKWHIIS